MFFHLAYKTLRPKRGVFLIRTFALLCLLLNVNLSWAQPKANIPESKLSFGSVKRGETVVLTFTVNNTGNAPLLLLDSEVSCSCTEVFFDKTPVLPGNSTLIQVKFNTKSVWGRQDRYVYLTTNSPEREIRLRYRGQVSKE